MADPTDPTDPARTADPKVTSSNGEIQPDPDEAQANREHAEDLEEHSERSDGERGTA